MHQFGEMEDSSGDYSLFPEFILWVQAEPSGCTGSPFRGVGLLEEPRGGSSVGAAYQPRHPALLRPAPEEGQPDHLGRVQGSGGRGVGLAVGSSGPGEAGGSGGLPLEDPQRACSSELHEETHGKIRPKSAVRDRRREMVPLGGGESGSPLAVAERRSPELRGALVPHHKRPLKSVQLHLLQKQPGT